MGKLDEIVSRSLKYEPRRRSNIEHVREVVRCRECETITETPAPSHPIPRGSAGSNLPAGVLAPEFMLHQH